MKKILFIATILLLACETPQPILGDVHEHADFKVFLNGEAYDFAQEKYMSTDTRKLSHFTHLHDGNGEVIHKHMTTITLGDFFESLGMRFTEECFVLDMDWANVDSGKSYCNNEEYTLKFFVNGKENIEFEEYEIKDLDQILISYGGETEEELALQLSQVTDLACIQSEKCPERGSPSPESTCLGNEDCVVLPQVDDFSEVLPLE